MDTDHEKRPDGSYEMDNQVLAFDLPRVISWKPGYVAPATGKLERTSVHEVRRVGTAFECFDWLRQRLGDGARA